MRYYSIQILRIVFMSMVLYLHVRAYLFIYGTPTGTFFHVVPDAFMAVALPFFSISGFIMAFLIDIGYRNFLPRRLLRVYPTYLCGVAIAVIVNYLLWDRLPGSGLIKAACLLPLGPVDLPLRVEWTLIYEIVYYVLITPFATPRLRRYFPAFLIVWGLAVLAAYFLFDMREAYVFNTWRTVLFASYNLYFITGALVYYLQKRIGPLHWSLPAAILAGCAVFTVISGWNRPLGLIKSLGEIGPWSLCTAATLFAVVKLEDHFRHPVLMAMADFGDYAYAYYLIHAVILSAVFSIMVYTLGWPLDNLRAFMALGVVAVGGYAFGRLDLALHNTFKNRLR
ncbi:acyltransferase family protein [Solidesulfovibrio sp.]